MFRVGRREGAGGDGKERRKGEEQEERGRGAEKMVHLSEYLIFSLNISRL